MLPEMAGVDGKPKQVWQKYLGTAKKIVELKEGAAELPHIKLYFTPPQLELFQISETIV